MSLCVKCNEKEKAVGAYLYCEECGKASKKDSMIRSKRKRRSGLYVPPEKRMCLICKEPGVRIKYCKKCGDEIAAALAKNRRAKVREEKRKKQQAERYGFAKRKRKSKEDMLAELQKPTVKIPAAKKEDGGIDPYFLKRGNIIQNGTSSSGFTQFTQE